VLAATDYVRAVPQLVAEYIGAPYTTLGTDGFGRSGTRADVRRFFEVDRFHIAVAGLDALARAGRTDRRRVGEAIGRYGLQLTVAPWLA
jgi:pyruvate dehydrogenase E1 component